MSENNFSEFRGDLAKSFDMDRAVLSSRRLLVPVAERFLSTLISTLPDGEDPVSGVERNSFRLWGQGMKESLTGPHLSRMRGQDGINIGVQFDHPSVEEGLDGDVLSWFEYGTGGHLMPVSDAKVVFWWGPPLKWGPSPGGVRSSIFADSWGQSTIDRDFWAAPQGDFTSDAYADVESAEQDAVDAVYSETMYGPLNESRYLRRSRE